MKDKIRELAPLEDTLAAQNIELSKLKEHLEHSELERTKIKQYA